MKRNDQRYGELVSRLKCELIPAMGCTEPIAIAYASAKAKEVLEEKPQSVTLSISGNIMKNANSVNIPNTKGLKGIKAAIGAGIVAGNPAKELEVLSEIQDEQIEEIKKYISMHDISVELSAYEYPFFIGIELIGKKNYVHLKIINSHMNIVYIEKNGTILYEKECFQRNRKEMDFFDFQTLWEFMEVLDISDLQEEAKRQVETNYRIAKEGSSVDYGSKVGRTILEQDITSIKEKAIAMAASASDARMSGCDLPVIILSGSGNQGITASIPIAVYYEHDKDKIKEEDFLKAIIFSDLLTIYQKQAVGKLSPLCGVVHAGLSSVAGIAYMFHEDVEVIRSIIVNGLGIILGVMCDGAKASCAAKIAVAIHAGFLGYELHQNQGDFQKGDGIITNDIDEMVNRIGKIAKQGMNHLDEEVLEMMRKSCN